MKQHHYCWRVKMRNFLVIENSVILDVVQKDGSFELSDFEGYYDTIAEDASGNFKKGDMYSVEKWEEYNLSDEEKRERVDAQRKALINKQLETLTVVTSRGNTFDANNQARLDMQNAITASDFLGATQTRWRMADNMEVVVELNELKEALTLAIQEYARVKGIL